MTKSDFTSGTRRHKQCTIVQLCEACKSLPHVQCSLLGSILALILTRSGASTAAVARTTVAMTRMHAGSADNVIPDTGSLMFNFRLLPGEASHTHTPWPIASAFIVSELVFADLMQYQLQEAEAVAGSGVLPYGGLVFPDTGFGAVTAWHALAG